MKKISLLIAIASIFCTTATAQMNDVTEQYIVNPSFESSTPLPVTECKSSYGTNFGMGYNILAHWNTLGGIDFADSNWKLEEQLKNANAGVVSYGGKVLYTNTGFESLPAAGKLNTSGSNAMCFCGNAMLIYKQTSMVTLPIGRYELHINVYPYNGQYSHESPTIKIKCAAGFVAKDGTEYPDKLSEAKDVEFKSNEWNEHVISFEITEATEGTFQVSYGTQYFAVIDDIKLTYDNSIITTSLENLVVRAEALNAELDDSNLATAILTAKNFIANPTQQSDVEPQVATLAAAMTTALAATTKAVNITAAYIDNPSFETGVASPWEGYGNVQEPINEDSKPYIDGTFIYDYTSASSSNTLYQTIVNMPAGYYMLDAKVNGNATMVINNTRTDIVGGVEYIFLRTHSKVENVTTAGQLKIGIRGTQKYKADDFRLFYAKDADALLAIELANVKADATAVLNDQKYASVTGSERTNLADAINGTDIAAINTAVNNLVIATVAYPKLEKTKQNAATYTMTAYPYALVSLYEQIQDLIAKEATTANEALDMASQLDNLCNQFYISNFYCEGVEHTDYSDRIISLAGANVGARTDAAGWKDPKTGTKQTATYGVKSTYPSESKDNVSALYLTLSNSIPEGTYVMSMLMMGSTGLTVDVCKNTQKSTTNRTKVGEMTGQGTAAGGRYGAGWNDHAIQFTRNAGDNYIILYCQPTENYKEWYVANFRIYHLTNTPVAVHAVQKQETPTHYYDLQGRRVEKPTKGLYIVNGKKVIFK